MVFPLFKDLNDSALPSWHSTGTPALSNNIVPQILLPSLNLTNTLPYAQNALARGVGSSKSITQTINPIQTATDNKKSFAILI
jgi:hypothetical protein